MDIAYHLSVSATMHTDSDIDSSSTEFCKKKMYTN